MEFTKEEDGSGGGGPRQQLSGLPAESTTPRRRHTHAATWPAGVAGGSTAAVARLTPTPRRGHAT